MESEADLLSTTVEQMFVQRLNPGDMKRYLRLYFGVEAEVALELLEDYELPPNLLPESLPPPGLPDVLPTGPFPDEPLPGF